MEKPENILKLPEKEQVQIAEGAKQAFGSRPLEKFVEGVAEALADKNLPRSTPESYQE